MDDAQTVQREYQGRVEFIKMSGPYAIYYHEITQGFGVHGTGAVKVGDEADALQTYEELKGALDHARELDRARGIGARWRKADTIVARFATPAPPVPRSLPDYRDFARDAFIRMGNFGMWFLHFDDATQTTWLKGQTAMFERHHDLESFRRALTEATRIEIERLELGITTGAELQARYDVAFEATD